VSASLVGRSSHVKLSVRSIARSILRCRNLIQRNRTVFCDSINVGKHSKYSRKIWISCCGILCDETTCKWNSVTRNFMFCLVWRPLRGPFISSFTRPCHWYDNLYIENTHVLFRNVALSICKAKFYSNFTLSLLVYFLHGHISTESLRWRVR
jgi:hypothetical protein